MAFPQIASYSFSIQQNGPAVFKTVPASAFIPVQTMPVKLFPYSSGMFAVVFKIRMHDRFYAVRCFLRDRGQLEYRYRCIGEYLEKLPPLEWLVPFHFIQDEFLADGQHYPVLIMDWIDGIPINKYVTYHLTDQQTLSTLQSKLCLLAASFAKYRIGHGDLQHGNMLVEKNDNIRLIDYDGLFVPTLANQQSIELGRPEFQSPRRTPADYNEKVDWFSIWVMLTALEAVKTNPALWNLTMNNGFNTQENFLFVAEDFVRPQDSPLFSRLMSTDNQALKFYTERLYAFCKMPLKSIDKPQLFRQEANPTENPSVAPAPRFTGPESMPRLDHPEPPLSGQHFTIQSNIQATILTPQFQKLGNTPCNLDKTHFGGKKVIVSSGNATKMIDLRPDKDNYYIEFI